MRARLALVPIAAAALLAGCGTESGNTTSPSTPADNGLEARSADEILAQAKTALTAAKSFHVKGDMSDQGLTAKVDFKVSGSDVAGTVEMQGANIELIKVGNDLYAKAPDTFWATLDPSGKLAVLKGKYAKADMTFSAFATMARAFTPDELLKPEGTVSKGEIKTINGTPAIGVIDSKDNSVAYIATKGQPLPVAFDSNDGRSEVLLVEPGLPVEIKAPSAAQVVDLKPLLNH